MQLLDLTEPTGLPAIPDEGARCEKDPKHHDCTIRAVALVEAGPCRPTSVTALVCTTMLQRFEEGAAKGLECSGCGQTVGECWIVVMLP